MMEEMLVLLFLFVCVVVCLVAYKKKSDAEAEEKALNFLSGIISNSICVRDGDSTIMLKKDFVEKEWNKEKNGIPVRGQYESAEHFMKRMNAYRKRKRNDGLSAAHKQKMKELTKKQQAIVDRWKSDIPKSEYEADEILKNYNGTN